MAVNIEAPAPSLRPGSVVVDRQTRSFPALRLTPKVWVIRTPQVFEGQSGHIAQLFSFLGWDEKPGERSYHAFWDLSRYSSYSETHERGAERTRTYKRPCLVDRFGSRLRHQILLYSLPEHGPPPLQMLFDLCSSVLFWLFLDRKHVAVLNVHELHAGKPCVLLCVLCCLLLALGEAASPAESIEILQERHAEQKASGGSEKRGETEETDGLGGADADREAGGRGRRSKSTPRSLIGWVEESIWHPSSRRYLELFFSVLSPEARRTIAPPRSVSLALPLRPHPREEFHQPSRQTPGLCAAPCILQKVEIVAIPGLFPFNALSPSGAVAEKGEETALLEDLSVEVYFLQCPLSSQNAFFSFTSARHATKKRGGRGASVRSHPYLGLKSLLRLKQAGGEGETEDLSGSTDTSSNRRSASVSSKAPQEDEEQEETGGVGGAPSVSAETAIVRSPRVSRSVGRETETPDHTCADRERKGDSPPPLFSGKGRQQRRVRNRTSKSKHTVEKSGTRIPRQSGLKSGKSGLGITDARGVFPLARVSAPPSFSDEEEGDEVMETVNGGRGAVSSSGSERGDGEEGVFCIRGSRVENLTVNFPGSFVVGTGSSPLSDESSSSSLGSGVEEDDQGGGREKRRKAKRGEKGRKRPLSSSAPVLLEGPSLCEMVPLSGSGLSSLTLSPPGAIVSASSPVPPGENGRGSTEAESGCRKLTADLTLGGLSPGCLVAGDLVLLLRSKESKQAALLQCHSGFLSGVSDERFVGSPLGPSAGAERSSSSSSFVEMEVKLSASDFDQIEEDGRVLPVPPPPPPPPKSVENETDPNAAASQKGTVGRGEPPRLLKGGPLSVTLRCLRLLRPSRRALSDAPKTATSVSFPVHPPHLRTLFDVPVPPALPEADGGRGQSADVLPPNGHSVAPLGSRGGSVKGSSGWMVIPSHGSYLQQVTHLTSDQFSRGGQQQDAGKGDGSFLGSFLGGFFGSSAPSAVPGQAARAGYNQYDEATLRSLGIDPADLQAQQSPVSKTTGAVEKAPEEPDRGRLLSPPREGEEGVTAAKSRDSSVEDANRVSSLVRVSSTEKVSLLAEGGGAFAVRGKHQAARVIVQSARRLLGGRVPRLWAPLSKPSKDLRGKVEFCSRHLVRPDQGWMEQMTKESGHTAVDAAIVLQITDNDGALSQGIAEELFPVHRHFNLQAGIVTGEGLEGIDPGGAGAYLMGGWGGRGAAGAHFLGGFSASVSPGAFRSPFSSPPREGFAGAGGGGYEWQFVHTHHHQTGEGEADGRGSEAPPWPGSAPGIEDGHWVAGARGQDRRVHSGSAGSFPGSVNEVEEGMADGRGGEKERGSLVSAASTSHSPPMAGGPYAPSTGPPYGGVALPGMQGGAFESQHRDDQEQAGSTTPRQRNPLPPLAPPAAISTDLGGHRRMRSDGTASHGHSAKGSAWLAAHRVGTPTASTPNTTTHAYPYPARSRPPLPTHSRHGDTETDNASVSACSPPADDPGDSASIVAAAHTQGGILGRSATCAIGMRPPRLGGTSDREMNFLSPAPYYDGPAPSSRLSVQRPPPSHRKSLAPVPQRAGDSRARGGRRAPGSSSVVGGGSSVRGGSSFGGLGTEALWQTLGGHGVRTPHHHHHHHHHPHHHHLYNNVRMSASQSEALNSSPSPSIVVGGPGRGSGVDVGVYLHAASDSPSLEFEATVTDENDTDTAVGGASSVDPRRAQSIAVPLGGVETSGPLRSSMTRLLKKQQSEGAAQTPHSAPSPSAVLAASLTPSLPPSRTRKVSAWEEDEAPPDYFAQGSAGAAAEPSSSSVAASVSAQQQRDEGVREGSGIGKEGDRRTAGDGRQPTSPPVPQTEWDSPPSYDYEEKMGFVGLSASGRFDESGKGRNGDGKGEVGEQEGGTVGEDDSKRSPEEEEGKEKEGGETAQPPPDSFISIVQEMKKRLYERPAQSVQQAAEQKGEHKEALKQLTSKLFQVVRRRKEQFESGAGKPTIEGTGTGEGAQSVPPVFRGLREVREMKGFVAELVEKFELTKKEGQPNADTQQHPPPRPLRSSSGSGSPPAGSSGASLAHALLTKTHSNQSQSSSLTPSSRKPLLQFSSQDAGGSAEGEGEGEHLEKELHALHLLLQRATALVGHDVDFRELLELWELLGASVAPSRAEEGAETGGVDAPPRIPRLKLSGGNTAPPKRRASFRPPVPSGGLPAPPLLPAFRTARSASVSAGGDLPAGLSGEGEGDVDGLLPVDEEKEREHRPPRTKPPPIVLQKFPSQGLPLTPKDPEAEGGEQGDGAVFVPGEVVADHDGSHRAHPPVQSLPMKARPPPPKETKPPGSGDTSAAGEGDGEAILEPRGPSGALPGTDTPAEGLPPKKKPLPLKAKPKMPTTAQEATGEEEPESAEGAETDLSAGFPASSTGPPKAKGKIPLAMKAKIPLAPRPPPLSNQCDASPSSDLTDPSKQPPPATEGHAKAKTPLPLKAKAPPGSVPTAPDGKAKTPLPLKAKAPPGAVPTAGDGKAKAPLPLKAKAPPGTTPAASDGKAKTPLPLKAKAPPGSAPAATDGKAKAPLPLKAKAPPRATPSTPAEGGKVPLPLKAKGPPGAAPGGKTALPVKAKGAPGGSLPLAAKPPPASKGPGPPPAKGKGPPPPSKGKSGPPPKGKGKAVAPLGGKSAKDDPAPLGRRILWKALDSEAVSDTIFGQMSELEGGGARRGGFVDMATLSKVFVKVKKKKEEDKEDGEKEKKPTKKELLDGKTATNMAIVFKGLKTPLEECLSGLLLLDSSKMGLDDIEKFSNVIPTDEIREKLKGYDGPMEELRDIEQNAMKVMKVPMASQRLRVLRVGHILSAAVRDVEENTTVMERAAKQCRASAKLRHVLWLTLLWGNQVNFGSSDKMVVRAITLESVLKLQDFKTAHDMTVNATHWLACHTLVNAPQHTDLAADMPDLSRALRISSESLDVALKAVSEEASFLEGEIKAPGRAEAYGETAMKQVETLHEQAASAHKRLTGRVETVGEFVRETARFVAYASNVSKSRLPKLEAFFEAVDKVAKLFDSAVMDVRRDSQKFAPLMQALKSAGEAQSETGATSVVSQQTGNGKDDKADVTSVAAEDKSPTPSGPLSKSPPPPPTVRKLPPKLPPKAKSPIPLRLAPPSDSGPAEGSGVGADKEERQAVGGSKEVSEDVPLREAASASMTSLSNGVKVGEGEEVAGQTEGAGPAGGG
uniref:FH2 domain-containing protein n=1 Tax=Chromera velia CCMP2878 TaxID=1169474 RepID=A0A0G4F7B4_9ALVE|eukprot:Cvel_15439.t1-p1 / transcript=Cvel_15439.t1 / gene=Cvel_15439 / organism=Chromera_velia_CCMP2878 / gene_product=Formin-like protein 14, putative / transcript_product=Formin-like protein 14, putative / location=Cvel_scaffold1142:9947-23331(+) / protein_length=3192 / sequence_SO=supercontig / SO=protein_coding / is_pseudo=false